MLKKIKKNIQDNKNIYITFLLGTIILTIIFAIEKIHPLGENSTLTVDFYHQYGPMLGEFYNRIKNGAEKIQPHFYKHKIVQEAWHPLLFGKIYFQNFSINDQFIKACRTRIL